MYQLENLFPHWF